MNGSPKISIVLPVYNGSKYLRNAIDSCLQQTFHDFELIVVDDCSKDETPAIVQSYSDPRIVYIRNPRNLRLPESLNVGFKRAKGDYLTWTSDDNQYLPTALEEMLAYLETHAEVDFVYTDMYVLNLETGEKKLRVSTHWTFYFENLIGASYLYRRKVYETIGGFDSTFEWIEDYEYWLRVEKKFSLRRLAKPLYIYGDHPQSLTNLKRFSIDMLANVLRYHHGYISFNGLSESLGAYLIKFPPFKARELSIWKATVHKISKMSLSLQFAFYTSLLNSIVKKFQTAAWIGYRKFVKIFQKDLGFQELLSACKRGDANKIQVLCVLPYLTMGGSEKVMQDVVRGLGSQGYDFHLFSFKKDFNPWIRHFLSHFVNYITINVTYDTDIYPRYLIKIIEKLNIQILLVTNEHMTYKALAKVKEAFPALKVIDIVHAEFVGGSHKHVSQIGAPFIDYRVCISQHLKDYLKNEYPHWGIPQGLSERIRVIHNGTHLKEFSKEHFKPGVFRQKHHIPENVKIISFIARMSHEKNPFIFIDIARKLIVQNPDLLFVMAGDGILLDGLKVKIKDYGLQKFFLLPGALVNVGELLADSYALVVVSTHEGIPLSIQESLFMEVPVISTRVGAIHEIVKDGVNGFLLLRDETVVDEVADRISYLLNNDQNYRQMVLQSRKSVYPEFTLETMCQRYREVFCEALNSKEKLHLT